MSLTLYVDGARLRGHLTAVTDRLPDLVPLVRGNGSGLGNSRLALEAQRIGADVLAVGTADECGQVAGLFDGDLLVLAPYRPFAPKADVSRERLVHTVSRLDDLDDLLEADPTARLVLARMTSTRVHGLSARELRAAAHRLTEAGAGTPAGPTLEGVLLAFPAAGPGRLTELHRLGHDVHASGLPTTTLWVTNLGEPEVLAARGAWPDLHVRPLLGDELWLGDEGAFSVRAHVLDLHRLERGSTFGEHGRAIPRRGHLVVLSGGMAHGIGLEPPTADLSLKARATSLARGSLDAAGLVRSPYVVDGKQRYFAEPPHMQASVVYLPEEAHVPEIGAEVELRVRFSTTTFDRTIVS
ncbi:alanine racemase [Nocardioides jiangxiensis]|uniref:Alanine racemase n=1 Tax=Nocardioides jiangxiensis TaxID=3064524 RepID=A0ABT9B015_9ACTN|nr:alanine racemase [Nocardioides sp. WY-20]MDO7868191.1 alanine racemase [Nocardioides sp. WY-20]